jgi:hypothetical protein
MLVEPAGTLRAKLGESLLPRRLDPGGGGLDEADKLARFLVKVGRCGIARGSFGRGRTHKAREKNYEAGAKRAKAGAGKHGGNSPGNPPPVQSDFTEIP